MLGQRRIRLPGIEPAIGCDAGPTFPRYWVDLHCAAWIMASTAMVVKGIDLHVQYILISLVLSIIIISWTLYTLYDVAKHVHIRVKKIAK